jgi:hypothetical protein
VRTWFVSIATIALAVAPRAAAAQFTAALVPAHMPAPTPALASNSSGNTAMPTQATRVDSSLGAFDSAFFSTRADSVSPTENSTPTRAGSASTVHSTDTASAGDTVFRDGASAPETESTLPTFALAGVGALLVGVALFRR